MAKEADIELKAIYNESWEARGQQVKIAALEAGIGEEVSELLYKLIAKVIRTAKADDGSDALSLDVNGVLCSFAYYDNDHSNTFAGAALAKSK